jgi:DNA-binding XRE family transcriptional regulator
MFHKIFGVKSLPDMTLLLWFADGEVRQYDVKPLMTRWQPFSALQDEQLFRQVKIVAGGYGISWTDDIDLACNELWENGVSVDLVKMQRGQLIAHLAQARRQAGLSQKQLEATSGVKQPVIARLECGDTNPQLETILRFLLPLGKTLGVIDLKEIGS